MDLVGFYIFAPAMKRIIDTTCPVSGERINGNAARAAAFFTIAITLTGFFSGNYFIALLLAVDFALRAFRLNEYSLIRLLAVTTVNVLQVKTHPVDAAPKRFAAGLGMIFCLAIAIFQMTGLSLPASFTVWMLTGCALLEGALGFCLGCVVYTFLLKIIPGRN